MMLLGYFSLNVETSNEAIEIFLYKTIEYTSVDVDNPFELWMIRGKGNHALMAKEIIEKYPLTY